MTSLWVLLLMQDVTKNNEGIMIACLLFTLEFVRWTKRLLRLFASVL